MISKLSNLIGVQFLLYATEETVPDYYNELLHSDHVAGGILFWLLTLWAKILSHFPFYRIDQKKRMDPVPVVLASDRVTKVYPSSSGGSDDFF